VLREKPRPLTTPGQVVHFGTEVEGEPDTFHLPSDTPQFEAAPPPERVFGAERMPSFERQPTPEGLPTPKKSATSGWVVPENRATASHRDGVPGTVVIEENAPGTSKVPGTMPSGLPVTMPLGNMAPVTPAWTPRSELPSIPFVPADPSRSDVVLPDPSRTR
jgi:hypothetical protein